MATHPSSTMSAISGRSLRRDVLGFVAAALLALAAFAAGAVGSGVPHVFADPLPEVTVSFTAATRDYDSDTDATVASCDVDGVVGDDVVTCDYSGATVAYDSKNAGSGVSASGSGFTLGGADAGNYNLTNGDTATGTGTINQVALNITAVAQSRPYDGTTASTGTPIVSGIQGSTDYVADLAQAYASKNVMGTLGSTIDVSAGYTVNDGNGGGNYIVATHSVTGTITAVALNITAVTQNRPYNGTTASTGTPTVSGIQGSTDYVADLAQAYASKNVMGTLGSTIDVSAGFVVQDDNGGNNYVVATHSVAGTITAVPLNIYAVTQSRPYDGTTASTNTPTETGLQVGDSVTGKTQAYASRHVLGTNLSTINVTAYTVNDTNSGHNYNVTPHSVAATITAAPLTVTATYNNKQANGNTAAAALPSYTPPLFSTDTPGFSETYDTAAANSGKTLTPAGRVNDSNSGNDYSYTYVPISTGNIYPAPAASLAFTAQPVDTEVSTPILSVCAPSGTAAPCASSVTAPPLPLTSKSTPVQVRVLDAYGNRAGTGAPGADANVVDVKITVKRDTSGGATLTSNVSTADGFAVFNDALSIATLGNSNRLYAVATTGNTGTPNDTSSQFRVVTDLVACDGTVCDNNASNNGGANQLQKVAGKITTGGDFYQAGTTNVLLSSQFVAGTETNQAACGNNKTIGQAMDVQVTGLNVGGTAPSTNMVIIMPKNTIKYFGVTARSATSFNVCFGALKVVPTSPVNKWKGYDSKLKTLVNSTTAVGREWAIPAPCGTAGLTPADPCIAVRSKQVVDLQTYLLANGWTQAQINALGMKDSDLGIVIRKGSPWDGKGGVF